MPRHVAHAQLAARPSTERDAFDLDEVGRAALHQRHIPAKSLRYSSTDRLQIEQKLKLEICNSLQDFIHIELLHKRHAKHLNTKHKMAACMGS